MLCVYRNCTYKYFCVTDSALTDPCLSTDDLCNVAAGHGQCVRENNEDVCKCNTGYFGKHCDTGDLLTFNYNLCLVRPKGCLNYRTCILSN